MREDEPSPAPDERGRSASAGAHRSRHAARPLRYQSLERDYERGYAPPPEDDYGGYRRDGPLFLGELQHQNSDLQRELGNLKKELELTNQKLGSSMHSIKTFWSPELKKERALRKEESAKYSLINDQLKLLNSENQKQAMLVRQLEEELRLRMRQPAPELQAQLEQLFSENEHLNREIAILRDTIKELELRIETQKQTLQARDESIKKLLEMLQNKGMGKEEERQMFQQMQAMAQKQLDEFRLEIQRRDQEILAMAAKMKALEEQHQDYQRHIAVLKESLCAKEEHYSMLQTDVEELKARLDEKSRLVEKKTAAAMGAAHELAELRDHADIKDRKINVLQRKLDLHEANKKLQATGNQNARAGDETAAARKQLQEEFKKLEDQKKLVDEQRRAAENKRKEVEEKEKSLAELDRQLKKRKEQMDQLEASLRKAGGSTAAVGEMNRKLTEAQKEADQYRQKLDSTKEESQRLSAETERLLQLVQMSQEEQNQKEKQIMELQQSLRNVQAKLKSQQQANAQREEENSGIKRRFLAVQDELDKCGRDKDDANKHLEESRMRIIDLEIELNESSLILSEVLKISGGDFSEAVRSNRGFVELQKSGKVASRLNKCKLSQSYNDLNVIQSTDRPLRTCKSDLNENRQDPKTEIGKLTRKIKELSNEIILKNSKIIEQQRCLGMLEEALRENNNIAEFDQLLAVVRSKDERINELEQMLNTNSKEMISDYKQRRILELEEALKESFIVATEREKVFYEEEQRRIETLRRMNKMEQRILSLQNASALNCETCRPMLRKLKNLESKLQRCQTKRHAQLQDLSVVIQRTLEATISEKDSRIAQLEECGVPSEEQTQAMEQLRAERAGLVDKLRKENERIVDMLRGLEEDESTPEASPGSDSLPIDLTLADDVIGVCDDNDIDDTPETIL